MFNPNRQWLHGLAAGIAGVCCLALSSCPSPMTEEMLLHVKDRIGPVITIISPAEGSYCAKTITVTGTVADSSSEDGEGGEVRSLAYQVLSTPISGTILFDADGTFSFQFSTASLGLNFVVTITAEDWNGNRVDQSPHPAEEERR